MDLATILGKDPATLTQEERAYMSENMVITTWSPDTCGCTVHFAWDKSLPVELRVHIPVESVTTHDKRKIDRRVCNGHASHQAKGKHVEQHDAILSENQSKNLVLDEIMKNAPSLTETVTDELGNTVKQWKQGAEPAFSFDANRKLKIQLKSDGLKAEKDIAKTRVASKFPDVTIT